MRQLGGILIALILATGCSTNAREAKLRVIVEEAYWIVSDGCAYSTDAEALAPLRRGKARYHHHKVQAIGTSRAAIYDAVEAQVNEMLARMDIDCPPTDSPQALQRLEAKGRELNMHVDAIERVLRERKN